MTTTPDETSMTWAMLAPLAAEEFRQRALRVWRQLFPGDDPNAGWPGTWRLLGGSGAYSVLIESEPGAEDTVEDALVADIMQLVAEPVYVIYFEHESGEPHQVIEWTRQGEQLLDRSPYALAESLGCPFPRPPRVESTFEGHMITVVPGLAPERVVHAVGAAMRDAEYEVIPCTRGTALRHPPQRMLPEPPEWLVDAFPDSVMLVVTTGPERGRFSYWEYCGGEARAAFIVPNSPILAMMETVAELKSVGDTRDPVRILENLGLDPAALDAG